jgi:hypothetical protein
MHEFALEGGDKALRHGVIQSGSGPSHRRNDTRPLQTLAERDRRILGAAVGVMHEAYGWFAPTYRHLRAIYSGLAIAPFGIQITAGALHFFQHPVHKRQVLVRPLPPVQNLQGSHDLTVGQGTFE